MKVFDSELEYLKRYSCYPSSTERSNESQLALSPSSLYHSLTSSFLPPTVFPSFNLLSSLPPYFLSLISSFLFIFSLLSLFCLSFFLPLFILIVDTMLILWLFWIINIISIYLIIYTELFITNFMLKLHRLSAICNTYTSNTIRCKSFMGLVGGDPFIAEFRSRVVPQRSLC